MQERVPYSQLQVGYEFPPADIELDSATVAAYLEAVEDTSRLYKEAGLIPPMAVAARAMAALSRDVPLPPGAIHVSQEFEFRGPIGANDRIVSHASVVKRQDRGRFHLLTIGLDVTDGKGKSVLAGKIGFMLP